MPEVQFFLPAIETKQKRAPIIKVSCGIGDTDGFPAFDGESEAYAAPDDPKWGFRITGGAEFHMPITVFQVTEGGLAAREGINLGDIILEINDIDVSNLTLAQAQEIIDSSGKKIFIIAKSMDYDDVPEEERFEEKSIILRVPKPMPPPPEFTPTPLLGSRMWHPIMWQDPPKPPKKIINEDGEEEEEEEVEEELPHHRIIRNIRRFFTENENNSELRNKYLEDMLLCLPAADKK